jgi:TFIIF-interacting CTD phosphatase-like protein
MVAIPNLPEGQEHKLTMFIELDDVLLHSYICDENFGYIGNPASKDPEHEFFIQEINQPCLVYMRDHWEEFMTYLKDNEDMIDPIVYTSAQQPYTKHVLNILDPKREVFKTVLYQNACYMFEIKEEEILFNIKDISRFRNRDIRRSVLLDPQPVNFMMAPENAMPVFAYTAEYEGREKDPHLLNVIEELDEIKDIEDIRPALKERYGVRQILKNSKLI